MADPVSMVAMGTTMVGSAVGAYGAYESGQAKSAMATYQAGVAAMNKQIAEQNAAYAISAGEVEAQQAGMKTRAQIGATKATQGASGLDVNRGSAVDVRASEAELGAYDQAIIRSNAARRAYGYQVEAAQDEAQSNIYMMEASQARTAGTIGAFSTLLGGATSVSSKWLQARSVGAV